MYFGKRDILIDSPDRKSKSRHGLIPDIVVYDGIVRAQGISFGLWSDATTLDGFHNKNLDMLAIPISGIVATSPKSALNHSEYSKHRSLQSIPSTGSIGSPSHYAGDSDIGSPLPEKPDS